MKTMLASIIAAAVMVWSAGLAGAATISSDVHALARVSGPSSATQQVYYHYHYYHYRHWRHRHCWWRYGHRHCRYW